jgi:hypothetical protein
MLDHAYRPLDRIHVDAIEWRGCSLDATRSLLNELVEDDVVEPNEATDMWRATSHGVEALNIAYSSRHPLTSA